MCWPTFQPHECSKSPFPHRVPRHGIPSQQQYSDINPSAPHIAPSAGDPILTLVLVAAPNVATNRLGSLPEARSHGHGVLPMDSRRLDEAIQYLVDRNKELTTVGQFIKELKYELGGQGQRYLKTLTEDELDDLFDRFKTLKQGHDRFSPVDSHGYNEIPSSGQNSEPIAGGPSFLVTDRSQPRHASLEAIFDIEIVPAHPVGREMIRSAMHDHQSSHSLIDPRTAADFCGCPEATFQVIHEIRLRWRTYKDGQGTGQLRETLCRIEHVQGANVVLGKGVEDEQKNIEPVSGHEGDDELMDIVAQMNLTAARKLQADRKRSTANHDESQRKRAKH